jgi:hypothetical protein
VAVETQHQRIICAVFIVHGKVVDRRCIGLVEPDRSTPTNAPLARVTNSSNATPVVSVDKRSQW